MSERSRMSKKSAREHYALMNIIKKLKGDQLKAFLNFLNDDGYEILIDCVYNALHCEAIPNRERNKLRKKLWNHRNILRQIAHPSVSPPLKKKKIVQFGSGIGLIASVLIPVLI